MADVLHHPNAGNLVENASWPERAIVHCFDFDPAIQPRGLTLSLGELIFAQRDSQAFGPILSGCVEEQSTPSTADIQQTVFRTDVQLTANQIQLRPLRLVERLGPLPQ